ncbi:hypothetical protein HDU85_004045 [Gaertneriomyces sp. JEL0708]|nr:hypothetical protein HDU85_004045 [Gaertneriomyces sp. JEL0708]
MQLKLIAVLFIQWVAQCLANEHSPKEAAPLAREIVRTVQVAELATKMGEGVHKGIDGFPFSTPEYVTDDCPSSGQPLLYLVTWGTHARNVRAEAAASVSFRHPNFTRLPPDSRGPLDEARVSLIGQLRKIEDEDEVSKARVCFFKAHPDAEDFPHRSAFYRLEVRDVRWIGGFGDHHFNGWIPKEMYLQSAQTAELMDSNRGQNLVKQWKKRFARDNLLG